MKLKKKVKQRLLTIIIIILFVCLGILIYKNFSGKTKSVTETKIVSKIDKYGYNLKENKPKQYKAYFKELEDILKEEEVNEEEYVKKITQLFIYDFYSLEDKEAKTDIGGVEFVYKEALDNFLKNAQDTYYKYVESNIYNDRNQKLPMVDQVEIESVEKMPFAFGNQNDEGAYKVVANWTYTSDEYNNYQKNATLIFIHDEHRLSLVELQ
ncbi:MAG: hypothetical protein IJG68_02240 [Bacilli bacterium]|nr:hypothetical protein [Bacilli bacterium]